MHDIGIVKNSGKIMMNSGGIKALAGQPKYSEASSIDMPNIKSAK